MRARSIVLLFLSLLAPGCGDGGGGADMDLPDASAPPDLTLLPDMTAPFPAPFPLPPQVVSSGGPLLKAPKVVPVFFANDDPTVTAQIGDFDSKVGGTSYWSTAVSGYGIGAAAALAPVQLTEDAPATIDDSAIQIWLAGKLNADDPAWPPSDGNTVYALHYPSTSTVTQGVAYSCKAFYGYHNDTRLDANHGSVLVAYTVVPRCASLLALTGIDVATGIESHELAEAATDPYPTHDPAYFTIDNDHLYWQAALGGAEIGDLCAQSPASFTKFPGLPYVVQRIWSNDAAAAGQDPCVPALPGKVYFNAAPEMADTVTFRGQYPLTGVLIPTGGSKTIPIDLFSEAPVSGPWTVEAIDGATLFGGAPKLSFSFDRTSGVNGDKLMLTIHVTQALQGTSSFALISTLNGDSHFWLGVVGSK